MNRNLFPFCFSLLFIFNLVSCTSLKEGERKAPESPKEKLVVPDYTQEDVINNEIENIKNLEKNNPVKALWRSTFINNDEIKEECVNSVIEYARNAAADEEYVTVNRCFQSLKACGFEIPVELEAYNKKYEDFLKEVPGFTSDTEKRPVTIQDCINATVTVWVDRGIKVQNGAGYADIVIGSGFFIDRRGYLITNNHVITDCVDPKYEGYTRLYVKLPSNMDEKIPAKVIGYDPVIDLALLKVEIEPEFVFSLGSSEDLSVGDKVSVIGTPIGLEGTLTSGIISSVDRKLTTMGNVFQLDAAVNSGNSGGPLIDENHTVQAIVFAGMLQFQGLNFAIPVEYLKQELPLLYNGGEYKHVWIGAYGHTKKIKNQKNGLEVQYVTPGTSSIYCGLGEDCIITKLGEDKITSLEDFQYVGMKYEYDTILTCEYTDSNQENKKALVYLEKRPEYPVEEIYKSDLLQDAFLPIFGMRMIPSSTTNRKSYKITKVINGTTAEQNDFSENDSVVVKDAQFDYKNQLFGSTIVVQRRKKGFIDIGMMLAVSLDSPYYF